MDKVIAIDHGNRLIKTINHYFPASYMDASRLAAIGAETLTFNGKEYVLTDKVMPQQNDKTEDERYYILNLFAIAKELACEELTQGKKYSPDETVEITLLLGASVEHCKTFEPKYVKHFKQVRPVLIEYKGTPYNIQIINVVCYPQGVAATFAPDVRRELKGIRDIYVADIGGYTLDGFRMTNSQPDPETCVSLPVGVNRLFERVDAHTRSKGVFHNIPVDIIEGMLRKDEAVLNQITPTRHQFIDTATREHTEHLLSQMALHCDFNEDFVVFMGGGSIMLENHIRETKRLKREPMFIGGIKADVLGYDVLYRVAQMKQAKAQSTASNNVLPLTPKVSGVAT